MKLLIELHGLLEMATVQAVKQFALHLQQVMLDKYDDVDVQLQNLVQHEARCPRDNWSIELLPRFERWPDYQPIINNEHSITRQMKTPGCLVGISRRHGTSDDKDHLYLQTSKGANWTKPDDVLVELDRKMMFDIERLKRGAEIERVINS